MPVSQTFNPPVEPGMDIATPFHTPITDLLPGVVRSMGYGPWGGRIDINTTDPASGAPIVEYYQHLDEIAPGLAVGSVVTAGQMLGLSGGQLEGGEHPNSPPYSTGPHVEVGLIDSAGQPMNPSETIAGGPVAGTGSGGGGDQVGIPDWLKALMFIVNPVPAAAASAVGGVGPPNLQQAAQSAGYAAGQVAAGTASGTIAGIQSAGQGIWSTQAGPWLKANIIPLLVALGIILVVVGTGDKQTVVEKSVPIPVPV